MKNKPEKHRRPQLSKRRGGTAVASLCLVLNIACFPVASHADEKILFVGAGNKPKPVTAVDEGTTLDLKRCLAIAEENQPAIIAAGHGARAAQSRMGQAKAGYFPKIDLSAGYNKTQPVPSPILRTPTGSYDQYTASASLSQTLYDFGKTSRQVDIQKFGAEAADSDLENIRASVAFGVKVAYYAYLQAQRNVKVGEETVAQLQTHLEQAQGFFAAGTKPKYDVTKAEVDISNARIAQLHAHNYVRLAKLNLDNAMGIPNAPAYTLVDDLDYRKYEISIEDAMAKAYEARPDIHSSSAKIRGAEGAVELARNGYYPTLSGYAQYNWAGTTVPLSDGWNVGVSLTLPLFSGFSTDYQMRESTANYNALVFNEEQLRQNVFYEVQQAYLNLGEAEEKIPAANLALRQAREILDLSLGRYTAGVGSPIEVTDAQIAYSNAQTAHIQSLSDYKVAQAALEKAIGGKQ